MKKLFAIIALTIFITSCNNSSSNSQSGSDSSQINNSSIDSMSSMSQVSEGTMSMRNGKMHVMTGGKWELMS